MKIEYYYFKNPLWEDVTAACKSLGYKKIERLISNYLMDSDIFHSKEILEELKNNELNEIDISTESWNGEVLGDMVRISSAFDDSEDFIDCISRKEFIYLLENWISFLEDKDSSKTMLITL